MDGCFSQGRVTKLLGKNMGPIHLFLMELFLRFVSNLGWEVGMDAFISEM
jgi:hypothetical protein